MRKTLLPLLLSVLLLAGCADMGNKQMAGGLLGGAAGGWAGSQIGRGSGNLAATAAGALIGAFLGSELGKGLDRTDQMYAAQAQQQAIVAAPPGARVGWQGQQPGTYGYTVAGPAMPVQTAYGQPPTTCREYQTQVTIGGRVQDAYGRACQGTDGQWRIMQQ